MHKANNQGSLRDRGNEIKGNVLVLTGSAKKFNETP